MTDRRSAWALSALLALFAGASPPAPDAKPWAFRQVVRPEVPKSPGARNPIDAFLARGHRAIGVEAAPEADRRPLIRRLSFDLIGLPPTPEEIASFLADDRPEAYERLVDRLSRTATGMYRLGLIDDEPADPVMDRFDQLDDMIKTIGTTMLGLTVHCARCHDHKFDPIKQADYYRLLAFLTPSKPYVRGQDESISVLLASDSERTRVGEFESAVKRQVERQKERIEALREPHRKAVAGMPGDATALADARLTASEKAIKQECERTIARLERYRPIGLPMVLGLTDSGTTAAQTHLMIRGDAHRPGKPIEPGFLGLIAPEPPTIEPPQNVKSTGRRLALARWIARPENPLTARVMVNRLWQHHFGRGLVATPSDFGAMGEEPSDPELLDWLASEFVAHGWSLKAMHRLIVTSDAYRRSGRWDEKAAVLDPANAKLWRFAPRRLEAEPIRDAILAVSGSLNLEFGGPSVRPEIDKAVLAGQSRPGNGWAVSSPRDAARRSVYVMVKRTLGVPELELLDAADNNEPCPKRTVTTTAPQALTLLNSRFLHEQAARFAERLRREAGCAPKDQVDRAFALAFGRSPTDGERVDSLEFLSTQSERIGSRSNPEDRREPAREALNAFCLVILNANEFVTID